jgi:hypothetical protein
MNKLNQVDQSYQKKPILFPDFDPSDRATHPVDKVTVPEKTFVVDSRSRNCSIFPSPSYYRIDLGEVYKNITSIELKGSIIPRSSYNVHSTNKFIDFSIGSSVTEIKLKSGGSGYTFVPTVTISPPSSGTQATATAVINTTTGRVISIIIGVAGSGYTTANPPVITIQAPNGLNSSRAEASAIVGTLYSAELRPGQYTIGGNTPSGLIKEVQNAMNYVVNGGAYNPSSTGPFQVRLVSQYPTLDADPGEPEYYDTNATQYNRVQIINTDNTHWELLWCSGKHNRQNAVNLLGFASADYFEPEATPAIGAIMSAGLSIRGTYDYDLLSDPQYVILNIWCGDDTFERIDSTNSSLDRKFATLVFDANYPDVITDTTGTAFVDGGVNYLDGVVTKGPFYVAPGVTKSLKGFDFDQKKMEFAPPIGKLSSITIQFTKYGPNQEVEYYDFCGRNHLLVFSVKAGDNQSGQKW